MVPQIAREVSGIELGGGALRADQVASCVALLCFYTNAIRGKICSRTKALFNCGLVCTMPWSGPTLRRTAFVGQNTRWTPRADHSVGAPWLLSSRGAAKLILSTERIRVECRGATSLAEKVARTTYVGQLTCYCPEGSQLTMASLHSTVPFSAWTWLELRAGECGILICPPQISHSLSWSSILTFDGRDYDCTCLRQAPVICPETQQITFTRHDSTFVQLSGKDSEAAA